MGEMMAMFTDAEALEGARNGNAGCFEHLYRKYSRRIYCVCLRMVRDSSLAEDLMQETFLSAYRRLNTFRGESLFSTWLHRIAVNVALMHLRKERVQPVQTPLEVVTSGEDEIPKEVLGQPDTALTGAADRVSLQRVIEQLPSGYRIVFLLHDVQGYQHDEIAIMLGCTMGNTKSQLHKARLRLRKLLAAQPPLEEHEQADRRLAA